MRPLVVALWLALAGTANASVPEGATPSVLATTVNGKAADDSAIFWELEGQWQASGQQWADLGLMLSPDEQQASALSASTLGVEVAYDVNAQSLAMKVPATRLPTQVVARRRSMPELSPAAPGLLINYNLAGQVGPDGHALSLGHELRTSGAWGTFQTTGQMNWKDEGGMEYRRGLTQWSRDDYERQIQWQAGDVLGAGASQPILGGIRVAKDPSLDPYTPTWPVPTLGGLALDPTTVEILANQSKVAQHDVGQGNFVVERFPLQPGRNALDVVVRDEFGRQQVVSSSDFYFAPRLLRDGLTTWSVAAGAIRQGNTNNYDGLGASFEFAHGLTDKWTITGSAQTNGEAHNAIVGVRTVLGNAGTLEVQAGQSSSELGSGSYVRGQYNYQGSNFGVAVSHETSDDWWTLAHHDGYTLQARERTQAALTWQSDDRNLRARFGGVDVNTGRTRTRYVDAGLSYKRGAHTLSGTALYDLQRGEPTLAASYRYNFGQGTVYATARSAPDADRFALGAIGRADLRGQRVNLSGELSDFNGDISARASASAMMRKGYARVDIDSSDAGTRVSGSWSGSVHIGKGGATFADGISDGYAVVEIPGVPGATVRANGQEVGKTNSAGRVVIPQLAALSETIVKVDTKTLPHGVELETSELRIAPKRKTGAWGQFKVLGTQARAFTLDRATPIESGATATTTAETTLVGFGGVLYLEQPQPGMEVAIEDTHGQCLVKVPSPLPAFEDTVRLACQ